MRAAALCLLLTCAASTHAVAGSWSNLWSTPEQQGQHLLDSRQPAAAAPLFSDPRRRGYAELRAGRYAQAAKSLAGLRDADSLYNRGNALAHTGQLQDALAAYDAALKASPGNGDIVHNRDLVARELQKQRQQNANNQQGGSGSGGSGQHSGSGGQQGQARGQQSQAGGQQSQAGSQQNQANGQQGQAGGQQGQAGAQQGQTGGQQGQTGGQQGQAGGQQSQAGSQQGQANGQQSHAGGQQGQAGGQQGQAGAQQGGPDRQQQGAGAQTGSSPPSSATAQAGGSPQGSNAAQTGRSPQNAGSAAVENSRSAAVNDDARTARKSPPPRSEQSLALDQWLRGIPDDSGELLRRKFLIEHMMKQQENPQ